MCRVRFKAKERYTAIADCRLPNSGAWKDPNDDIDVQPTRRYNVKEVQDGRRLKQRIKQPATKKP